MSILMAKGTRDSIEWPGDSTEWRREGSAAGSAAKLESRALLESVRRWKSQSLSRLAIYLAGEFPFASPEQIEERVVSSTVKSMGSGRFGREDRTAGV